MGLERIGSALHRSGIGVAVSVCREHGTFWWDQRQSRVEVGEQLLAVLFEHCDLGSELLQFTVDPRQLGPGAPLPMVAIVVSGLHKLLELAPQKPQPGVAVNDADSVLKLTGVDRRLDLSLSKPELLACGLVAER
jgi:hypothetical protein